MRKYLELGWKLLLITLVAGLALGATYAVTREPIRLQNQARAEQARKAIFGDAGFVDASEKLKALQRESDRYAAVTGAYFAEIDGRTAGCVIAITAEGYGGAIELTVGIDAQGRVVGLRVGSHSETPGLGSKAAGESFAELFAGKIPPLTVVKGEGSGEDEINAITGATVTSRGVADAVNLAALAAKELMGAGGN